MADNYTNCSRCGSNDLYTEAAKVGNAIGQYCRPCGNRWLKWIDQGKYPDKRPKLETGTTDKIWAASMGYCAHCGLSEKQMEFLGLQRTVQHVPPFKVNGHDGYLIPLCSWCQQNSAVQMKRLESLITRLCKKFSIND